MQGELKISAGLDSWCHYSDCDLCIKTSGKFFFIPTPQITSIMNTPLGCSPSPSSFSAVSTMQGGHDPRLGHCVATTAQEMWPRGNAGAYLGWPGSECGRRVPWCCRQPRSRSWALPSCSRARQHPRRTASPGAGSGREGSCWRTCRTAGGKGFVVSTENSMDNRPGARLQIVGKEVLFPVWFGVQLFPKEPSNSCSSPRAFPLTRNKPDTGWQQGADTVRGKTDALARALWFWPYVWE